MLGILIGVVGGGLLILWMLWGPIPDGIRRTSNPCIRKEQQ